MELEPLRVQVTRYCYDAISGFGEYKYKLHSIKRSEQVLNYPVENIEKVSPSAQGLKQLSLFNKLYIPHCNSIAIQFAFTDPDASESVFSLVFWLPLFGSVVYHLKIVFGREKNCGVFMSLPPCRLWRWDGII